MAFTRRADTTQAAPSAVKTAKWLSSSVGVTATGAPSGKNATTAAVSYQGGDGSLRVSIAAGCGENLSGLWTVKSHRLAPMSTGQLLRANDGAGAD